MWSRVRDAGPFRAAAGTWDTNWVPGTSRAVSQVPIRGPRSRQHAGSGPEIPSYGRNQPPAGHAGGDATSPAAYVLAGGLFHASVQTTRYRAGGPPRESRDPDGTGHLPGTASGNRPRVEARNTQRGLTQELTCARTRVLVPGPRQVPDCRPHPPGPRVQAGLTVSSPEPRPQSPLTVLYSRETSRLRRRPPYVKPAQHLEYRRTADQGGSESEPQCSRGSMAAAMNSSAR